MKLYAGSAGRTAAPASAALLAVSLGNASSAQGGGSWGLNQGNLNILRQFLADHSAVILDESKGYLAESRLTPLAYREGMDSAQELLAQIRQTSFGRSSPQGSRCDDEQRDLVLPRSSAV